MSRKWKTNECDNSDYKSRIEKKIKNPGVRQFAKTFPLLLTWCLRKIFSSQFCFKILVSEKLDTKESDDWNFSMRISTKVKQRARNERSRAKNWNEKIIGNKNYLIKKRTYYKYIYFFSELPERRKI